MSQVVDKADTSTAVVSSKNPSQFGDAVTFTATVTGGSGGSVQFKNGTANLGDPVSLGTDGKAGFTTSALGVGTHSITAVYSGTDTLATSTSSAVSQVVDKRALTVTANPERKVYGDADPPLKYEITAGSLLAGDRLTGSLSRAVGENAGVYAITQGSLTAGDNYAITFIGGTLTVDKAELTVTAENKSRAYGNADPAATHTLSGFVGQENATSAGITGTPDCTIAQHSEGVGTYADIYNCAPGTLSAPNYRFVSGGKGSLTITARPITVTANNQTKVLGASDPALTYSVSSGNLVNGDTLTGALARTAGEAVGSYSIQQGSLAVSNNYSLTYVPGTLRIQYAAASASCYGSLGRTILQPVNSDGSSIFKLGSTVPAKFRVCDANGTSIGTAGVVANFKLIQTINGTTSSTVNEDPISTTADTAFRWSDADQQWIYNISTKNLKASNTYVYRVTLNDGTYFDFKYGLK